MKREKVSAQKLQLQNPENYYSNPGREEAQFCHEAEASLYSWSPLQPQDSQRVPRGWSHLSRVLPHATLMDLVKAGRQRLGKTFE